MIRSAGLVRIDISTLDLVNVQLSWARDQMVHMVQDQTHGTGTYSQFSSARDQMVHMVQDQTHGTGPDTWYRNTLTV